MNKNHKAGNREKPILIVTAKRMNNHYVKKFKLSDEVKVTLYGCEIRHRKLVANEETDVEMYSYFASVSGKVREKLMQGTQVVLDGETAYYFCPKRWFLVLLPLFLALFTVIVLTFRQCDGNTPIKNVLNDDKIEQSDVRDTDGGIVYNGFPSSFTITSDVQYLSVQNSMDNAGKYYTGARIIENDEVIYDMGQDVISPGKYANINLYEILSAGEHKLTIVQYGCGMDKNFTDVATGTSQVVTVNVKK